MLTQAGFAVTALLRSGQVEDVLCAYRTEHAIDLIVMGAYGHSRIREFLVDSTTTQLIRQARIPLLLLRRRPGPVAPDSPATAGRV